MTRRSPLTAALVAVTVACSQPSAGDKPPAGSTGDSLVFAEAITAATQRLKEHGQAGLSLKDVERTRDWFTPELYALLVRDMSDPGGVGYLNWDPFTDAQDDVGPFRFEDVHRAGDTIMVRFSREGYQQKRDSVTLAMRKVDSTWRIATFLYSQHSKCHQDLAVGLARYARRVAADHPVDDTTCTD